MKKTAYLIGAILAWTALILLLFEIIPNIEEMFNSSSDDLFFMIVSGCSYWLSILVLSVLTILQLKKSTPKLLLIFSGDAVITSMLLIFYGSLSGYFMMAAGLLPAAYEFIYHGILAKKSPQYQSKFSGMLAGAGIVTCIGIIIYIISLLQNYLKSDSIPPHFYFLNAGNIFFIICLAVFCFLKKRRTSVLYRMFFVGPSALGTLFIPVTIMGYVFDSNSIGIIGILGNLINVTVVLLILIHTFKTRHDSIIPQEHIGDAPQSEISVV